MAVTDPGSKMQKVAEGDTFGDVFFGDKTIGGRYSVLSNFGMVPAAAMGLDLKAFTEATAADGALVRERGRRRRPIRGPSWGSSWVRRAKVGRDKVTIFRFAGVGGCRALGWSSCSRRARVRSARVSCPLMVSRSGRLGVYGDDRVFAYLKLAGESGLDAQVAALEAAGQPVVRIEVGSAMQVGQVFFLWEFATAVAGSVIGINPFDQPDVEASKIETQKLMDTVSASGSLPAETPFASGGGIKLFADNKNANALGSDVAAALKAQFDRVEPGDYVALLAYVERDAAAIKALTALRTMIRDKKHVATCVGFGPRFLHSTGQVYKGGPNSGVVLQITADHPEDLAVPGETYGFATVIGRAGAGRLRCVGGAWAASGSGASRVGRGGRAESADGDGRSGALATGIPSGWGRSC